ncbi:MAG: UvrD-helicase domain-containing protein [Proteobacteria bacterium]|nr:UvrD-helicase domain-containing protein [Pseudomonadota bacterium]
MELNFQQQQAVEHGEGPLLILAGPGSGKTRVLTSRIAGMVESGAAHPSQILAVTFTNKAAEQMRTRVERLVGPAAREISMGTFHSVCLRLLRSHSERAGLPERFVVYDDSDQLSLVKECMATLDIDRERMPPRAVLERISRAKDSCQGPEEFAAGAGGNPYLARVAQLYSLYQRRLSELAAADFGDLIRLAVKILEGDSSLLESYRRRWRHILVDEYQDTNHAQYRFVSALARDHRNICVVGDDDQSIYRWRGADIQNILRFEHDFPGARVIRLEQNYRSTAAILAAASSVVSRNAGRKAKEIWTEKGAGAKVEVLSCESEKREAEAVAARIEEAVRAGRRYSDHAVFYRINAQSRPLEEVFRERGMPYRIYGGIRFYERAEIKDVLAYLRLLLDRCDDVGLLRVINSPARGLGRTTVERLKSFAAEMGSCIFDAIGPFVDAGIPRGAQSKRLLEFRDVIEALSDGALERPMPELTRDLLDRTGYVEALVVESTIESEARIENINEMVAAVEEFAPAPGSPALVQFLDQVALISDADAIDDERGAVTMMTLHIAKGLEFPSVYMVGLEEGLLPHARSTDDPDELEEERRLCYVGMTRAMDRLTLAHAFRRSHFGQSRYNVASRFLDDLPHEHSVRIPVGLGFSTRCAFPGPGSRVPNSESRFPSHGFPSPESRVPDPDFDFDQRPPDEREGLARGMRVRHPTFGFGIVKAVAPSSAGQKVTVEFRGGVTKKLIAELANLIPA